MLKLDETPENLSFRIFVQPKSSKNKVVGLYADPVRGDALKVKITAPPVDGAANAMCIKFFAKLFGISKSSIEILSGQTGRSKRVCVHLDESPEGREKRSKIVLFLNSHT